MRRRPVHHVGAELLEAGLPRPDGRVDYDVVQTIRFEGSTDSGCGPASAEMGPFYCPNDKRVYLDTTFFDDMLEGQLGAEGGPFAIGYVIAHEYGHHVEDQLGVLGKVRTQKGPNSDAVRVELMADCLAGVWAKGAQETKDQDGRAIIEDLTQDDIKRAIDAAEAVGDDRIQKRSGGPGGHRLVHPRLGRAAGALVQQGTDRRHHQGLRHVRDRPALSR